MADKLANASRNLCYTLEGLAQNSHVVASQVWRRLQRLGLDTEQTRPPNQEQRAILEQAALLDSRTPNLLVGLENVTVDLRGISLSSSNEEYALRIISCRNVRVLHAEISDPARAGILVSNCQNLELVGPRVERAGKSALTIAGRSIDILVADGTFHQNKGGGIVVCDGSRNVRIARCRITDGAGKSNWTSGIVLTDRWVNNMELDCWDMLAKDQYWAKEQPILDRTAIVSGCIISDCTIAGNMASGVYMDGALQCAVINNEIENNSKEGICLDYGASLNVCLFNRLFANGARYGKTDDDLARDHVLQFGRMEDGTATAKVPAISLDNAAGNIIQHNTIASNFGSGVKMVRASFMNSISFNTILDNNRGANHLHHFFGVEVGAAPLDGSVNPNEFQELDSSPSSSNVIHANIIKGGHYAGLFFAQGTKQNNIFDNIILEPSVWTMESVDVPSANVSLNNIGFLPSKGIGLSRLVPNIIGLGEMVL